MNKRNSTVRVQYQVSIPGVVQSKRDNVGFPQPISWSWLASEVCEETYLRLWALKEFFGSFVQMYCPSAPHEMTKQSPCHCEERSLCYPVGSCTIVRNLHNSPVF